MRWLLALAAAWAGGAAGHAGLAASIPADGAALAAPPATIELRFTEPVKPLELRLFAGSATPVALPAPQGASEVIKLALPANLGEGLYTLSWRAMSVDSHPIGGSIVFAVGDAPPPHAAGGTGDSAASAWAIALRAMRDLALLIAAGGALFVLCVARFPGERAVLGTAGGIAIGATLLDAGGLSAGVASAGALMICLATTLPLGRARQILLLLGALTAVASLPLTGHARTAQPVAVAATALAAHGLAAAFWMGSLAALLAMTGTESNATVLRRFSRWGMAAVALLVIAGVTFALLQLDAVAQLYSSRYGLLIAGKVILLAALLALAGLNRFRWLPMLERGARAAAVRLRWSIAGELALAVCVIGLTAALVQTPPPRVLGFTQKLAHKSDVAEVSVRPARAGANAIVVRFRDREGLPFDPEEVLVEIGNQAAGVEPAPRAMRRLGPGDYRRDGAELAFPGEWTIEVQARSDGGDIARFRSQVRIR